ncbi:hypothetical protein B0H10DRAFT_2068601 [Mycena sp. CBHHK59/15]|nr:hypothetical protein B0H10DRAFT_2068601 [Mycena sp. CBHHK59/15]
MSTQTPLYADTMQREDMETSPPDIRRASATPNESLELSLRRHAMDSFENLVALANYQERLKGARKILWRDKGQPVVELPTLRDCLGHAWTGGVRSATLGFNIRASFNLFLALIRLRKIPRDRRLALLRHAVFGTDSLRFAAMLGTFAALYKFLINALPILIPAVKPRARKFSSVFEDDDTEETESRTPDSEPPTPSLPRPRSARLSLSAHAQMVLVRKRTRRWHSALAGAVAGGLAILWEKRSRREVIAQQIFVRGLQGTYNTYSQKWGISIPYGAAMVFTLSCGQIMYAFMLHPESLPPSYDRWILATSQAPKESQLFSHRLMQEHVTDISLLDKIIAGPNVAPAHLSAMRSLRERALNATSESDLPHHAPCHVFHPTLDGCLRMTLTRLVTVTTAMLPIYSALHFVPTILLRWRMFCDSPRSVLARAAVRSLRSSFFIGVFTTIFLAGICIKNRLYDGLIASPALVFALLRKVLPPRAVDFLVSKASFWLLGIFSGLSILVEDPRRRAELAMYVLPKGLQTVWVAARGRGLVFRTGNWGEGALMGLGMGMVMTIYQNDPQHLSGFVRKIIYQFIGPN